MTKTLNISDHELYELLLGGVTPPLSQFPNLVVSSGPGVLRQLASVTGDRILWWGTAPIYAEDSRPNTVYQNYLNLWSVQKNQEWLMEHGGSAKIGHFTMYLPARVPEEILSAIDHRLPENEGPIIDTVWSAVAPYLGEVDWVYMPLSEDYPIGVVVTSTETDIIPRLENSFNAKHIPFGRLVSYNGRETWDLGMVSKT